MEIEDKIKNFEDYLTINTNSSFLTIKKYKAVIRRFLLTTNLSFSIDNINNWLIEVSKKKNCNYYKYAFKHFLISIGRKELIDKLPMIRKKPRKKVFPFIPKETMNKIINSLSGLHQKLAFLQLKLGARVTEIMTLRAENIDFRINPKMIQIKVGINKSLTKRNKEKTLYLSKKYETLIHKWLNGKTFGYIFLKPEFEHYDEETLITKLDSIRRDYDNKLTKTGEWYHVNALSSHYLRHLFADYFIMAGGNPIYLKDLLGHSKMDTTLDYISINNLEAQKVLLQMEGES